MIYDCLFLCGLCALGGYKYILKNKSNLLAFRVLSSAYRVKNKEEVLEKTKPIHRALPGNPRRVERVHLKKQSQFAGGQIGVNSYMKGDYGIKQGQRAQENKAKQTQSRLAPSNVVGLKNQILTFALAHFV
jgi:hypothetical protein